MKKLFLISPLLLPVTANVAYAIHSSSTVTAGKALYKTACKLCHSPEKAQAMDAPAAFNVKAWQQRFSMAEQAVKKSTQFKTSRDYLYHQIRIGKGLMHHGGLCQESTNINPNLKCDKADYLAAIDYMSDKSN